MYDEKFWNQYADENESRYNEEFAKYTSRLAESLGASSVLEIGCGTGIDLRLFSSEFTVNGVDLNDKALDIARKKLEHGNFENATITKLPFEDESIDFVFTHQLLNYLDDHTLRKGVAEMYRVAKKFIMNCEKFEETEKQIDAHHKSRNMLKWWSDYNVKIISHVDMHKDIDPDKSRFTLIKKL